jgi:protein-tyrosine phosphatase
VTADPTTSAEAPDEPDDPDEPVVRVCFVCLGNICRSPTAEAVMRHLVGEAGLDQHIEIDSAGTAAYHVGDPPDRRSAAEAERRGVPMTGQARRFHPGDFEYYDLVLAMDSANLADLRDLARTPAHRDKVRLLRTFDSGIVDRAEDRADDGPPGSDPGWDRLDLDVPDPYYGEGDGFALVFDLVDAACRGLLDHLREEHDLP